MVGGVRDVLAGYTSNAVDNWNDGWTVTLDTVAATTVTATTSW